MVSDRTLNKIAAVGVVAIILGLSSGRSALSTATPGNPFNSSIRDIQPVTSTDEAFVTLHSDEVLGRPANG